MTKPRICFVTPPSAFLLLERTFVNLGILKVAAAARDRGYPVEHLDLTGIANYIDVARIHAERTEARIFALTATTPQMPAAADVLKAIKTVHPGAKTILGGPHATVTAAAAKKYAQEHSGAQLEEGRAFRALGQLRDMFDVIVAGDGEDAIEQAVTIGRGLVDADDPQGPLFLTKKRVGEVPWPARDLVALDSYDYEIEGVPATTAIMQLGCPYMCTFCCGRASPMLRRARMRSTESALAELEHLYVERGYRGVMLYDDELNVNPKMVELMRGIAALGKKHRTEFKLRGFVKAELLTQEQADVMYEAGFRELLCGFESAHPRILENIQKKATVEDNDRAVLYARRAGLKVKALMSIGHAGESEETIAATRRWLLDTRPDNFDVTIIVPYPGSPYYDEAFLSGRRAENPAIQVWTYRSPKSGDLLHMEELDYMTLVDAYKGRPGGYVSHVFTDHLASEDLVRLRDALEEDVRHALGIKPNPAAASINYEHSMGQPGPLPATILRTA